MDIGKILLENWVFITIIFFILLLVLIALLWRNYYIDEITPTPPFIKFKRKVNAAKPEILGGANSIVVRKNSMFGKNKISVRRENSDVSENNMVGENEIEAGAKPGPKPKKGKKKL